MKENYIIYNSFMEQTTTDRRQALRVASLNAAAVEDSNGDIIADYRTEESEADKKG